MKIEFFVVRSVIMPAAPEDADPFESETAQDGLTIMTGALTPTIIGFGPVALDYRLPRPFDESLA